VPADGDTAHAYTAPGDNDIRGPCPGLNAAANHNFLSHDGITNFVELVDAQQNVYNVGHDLAVLLAVLGIQADGDLVTTKLSIGCDATSRTATLPLLGTQPGLNGHNKFEADTSLTRSDYFLNNGDNYSFNGSLFAEMKTYADRVSNGNFDRNSIAAYRSVRYDESVQVCVLRLLLFMRLWKVGWCSWCAKIPSFTTDALARHMTQYHTTPLF
jgi:hypothetical protein